jgi:hypothetical protein
MFVGPKRSASAGTRNANDVRRAGPVVTTRAEASCPRRPARKLLSSASPRIVPHHSPAHASATPSECETPPVAGQQRTHDGREGDESRKRRRRSQPHGERDPHACRPDEERRPARVEDAPHGVTSSLSCSTRAGPTPGTSSRSSTDPKGPCAVLQSTIFCAVTGTTVRSSEANRTITRPWARRA